MMAMGFRSRPVVWLLVLLLAGGLVGGGRWYYTWQQRLVRVGDVAIDPLRAIDPTKVYDVLVWEYDLYIPAVDRELRRAALEAAAAELRELYPNIRVRFEWLESAPPVERLIEALEAGVGPDIAALAGGTVVVDTAHQIPVTPYMSSAALEDLLPAVQAVIRLGDHLWVWPRWIDTAVWLGRTAELTEIGPGPSLAAEELLRAGQTWQSARRGQPPIAYNAYDPALFQGIAVGMTGKTLLTTNGELAWSQEEIARAAEVLTALGQAGLISKDVEGTSRSRLRRFYEGEAVVMGPVNRSLLHHVLSRIGDLTHDSERIAAPDGQGVVTLLAAPLGGGEVVGHYGTVTSYAVFRREEHPGDDHTQAVMQVAQHLSRRMGYWEAANLVTVPPYVSSLTSWPRDVGLMQQQAEALIWLVERLVGPPADSFWAQVEEQAINEVIMPLLPQLIQGTTTAERFAEDVWKGVQAYVAARTAPSSALQVQ